ncbi:MULTISPECIES: LacI family DNA-binding transcriptional regulator [unclassified Rathayibacter]|uniref:LacI family DNA-binding transcriptional regulator n=1 Tax=unclassified Rathayibacter TaxID=2609250 RepID=UPI000F4B1A96|nr:MULTISPECIES: LacI family DNA-binding transcriptional regulator [unclassified Rathayibacter]MCJ1702643.1 LacI family DNA-binding transcriptional regulator [Rathayibacter sp. VKM Ac-2926]TCL85826.1 LacI family transcriptional regulator [Rathayibacter sp. PhB192]TCM31647.1 LacI family transcriptional regulator [Rathayibacter sp. PhB179]
MVDVARLAGVSQQTVSRVVNGSDNVAADVRERVERAIAQLRYRPNPAARALANRRSMNIGIVSFGLAQYGPSVALTGIADEARRSGYATNLVTLGAVDRSSMRSALDHLVADLVDGIVVLAPLTSAVHAVQGFDAAVPLVAFEPGGVPSGSTVVTDEEAGARLATEHLLGLGHRTVHHLAGPAGWLATEARIRGWTSALGTAGRVLRPALAGDWSTCSGYRAGAELAADPDLTAVYAANDQMALGLLAAFADAGLRVPADVSVVGFDDIPEARYFRPGLSTVRFDFEAVGRLAVDRILALMGADDVQHVTIPAVGADLVPRASTAAPRSSHRPPA